MHERCAPRRSRALRRQSLVSPRDRRPRPRQLVAEEHGSPHRQHSGPAGAVSGSIREIGATLETYPNDPDHTRDPDAGGVFELLAAARFADRPDTYRTHGTGKYNFQVNNFQLSTDRTLVLMDFKYQLE